MRVSQHSGREGNARHNDRTFLSGLDPEQRKETAPNIDSDRTAENIYMTRNRKGKDFRESELLYYESHYGAAIEATNNRYRAEGHADRCKTVEQVYNGKKTRPEEIILQIGNIDDSVTAEDFKACISAYLRELNDWNHEHGNHMKILTFAVHLDEASPHAHIRRVWDYTDKDGLTRIGQNKALEAAGVGLPDPDKPEGRYNNRKITFDKMMRQKWQEIAKAHGYQIETEPRPNMRHKDKAEYIAGQLQRKIDVLEKRTNEARGVYLEALEVAQGIQRTEKAETVRHGIGKRSREVVELSPGQYEAMQQAVNALTIRTQQLQAAKEKAEEEARKARTEKARLEAAIAEACEPEQRAAIYMMMMNHGRIRTDRADHSDRIHRDEPGRS